MGCCCCVASVVSNSVRPHGRQPTRLLSPWDFPGKCAGGAHHTVLSYDVSAEMMKDFANIMGIEFVHISKNTTVESLEEKLLIADLVWKLR